jgi:outer membrane protein
MAKLNQERFAQEDFQIDRLNNPNDISDFQTSLTVEQPVFVPKVHTGLGIAKNELKVQEAGFELKKEEVALNVVKMFLGVQTAQGYLTAARKKMEDALEHKRIASLRYDVGTTVYSDKLRTEVEVKKAEASLENAKAGLDVSRRALGLALGTTEPVDVAGERIVFPLNDLNTYLEASLNRKDIKALRIRYENAKAGVRIEKAGLLPEIGIRGSYQLNDHKSPFSPEGKSYVIMGVLKWDLFDASKYSRIKKAKAGENMLEQNLTSLKNRINFGVHDAYIKVKERKQNLALSEAILKEAEEAVRLVRLRYENSLASVVELLDTQAMLDNARADLVRAKGAYTGSIADLCYQSGILLNTLNNIGGNINE